MVTRVRTARLRSRLSRYTKALPIAASLATENVARDTVNTVVQRARSDGWDSDDDQVGFDFDQWVRNVDIIDQVASNVFGAFSKYRMGTAEDFEKISQSPSTGIPREDMLWHTGRRMGDSFRRLIVERPANRAALADLRRSIWGEKTPQWWFKNYGSYFAGSYPMMPGTFSIETGALEARNNANRIVSGTVNAYLRREGLLV